MNAHSWMKRTHVTIALVVIASLCLWGHFPARADGNVGYRDFSYGDANAPSADKPQSKLWYNDGRWWGSLFNPSTRDFEIYRFNWSTNTWITTGTLVDGRRLSQADCLWDGAHLYIATNALPNATGDVSACVRRYSYDSGSKRYTLDSGFPVTLVHSALDTIVLDKDSTGRVWVTFTNTNGAGGRNVYVAHSTGGDRSWTAPYVLPVAGAANLKSDDISAVVAFNHKIGVMWSNQNDNTMYFATHADGDSDKTWRLNPALAGPKYVDNHINLKSLQADPSGQVFAAVKTSLNDVNPPTSTKPLILLLTLGQNGSWSRRTFGRVCDGHTRPIVLIDRENRQIYMFATVPIGSPTAGAIYCKQTSLDDRSKQFPDGLGTPFILNSADTHINNATSTKQALSSSTGLLVLASGNATKSYFHNRMSLKPLPTPTGTPSATTLFKDGFEQGNWSAWTAVRTGADGAAVIQSSVVKTGTYAARLSATSTSGSFAYARKTLSSPQADLTASGDFRVTVEGAAGGAVPLLRLFDGAGRRLLTVYRVNHSGDGIAVGYAGNSYSASGHLPLNTWGHFEMHAITGGRGNSTVEVRLNGTTIYRSTSADLGSAGVSTIQIGNDTAQQAFTVIADNIQVTKPGALSALGAPAPAVDAAAASTPTASVAATRAQSPTPAATAAATGTPTHAPTVAGTPTSGPTGMPTPGYTPTGTVAPLPSTTPTPT